MKNKLFQSGVSIIRILEFRDDEALVIDCIKKTMPAWIDATEITAYKPYTEDELLAVIGNVPTLEMLESERIRVMHERYTMINDLLPFISDERIRASKIRAISQANHISKQTVRNHLCVYLAYMDIMALAPKKKDSDRDLTADEKNIRWGLNKFFYTQRKNSLHTAYTLMLKHKYCDTIGNLLEPFPSFYQFRYFYRKTKKLQNFYISRNGLKEYQKNKRPLLGDGVQEYASVLGTGMIDATICDIYLVDNEGRIVGRPVLTICVDVFSGLIMGYSLTWEGGTYSLRDMMLNVISDKVEHCKRNGIVIVENEWPSAMLPAKLVSDQGTEYVGDTFGQIVELGVKLINLPAYRPDLKSCAEKTFDMIQERFLPHLKGKGVVEPDYRERGSHDYRKDARLNIEQFEKIVIRCILFCNNHRIIDKYRFTDEMLTNEIKPYAADIWNWGIHQTGCNLLQVEPAVLILTLLPRAMGRFSRYGLKVNGIRYYHEGYTEMYLKGGGVTVAFNPENSNYVWLIEKGSYIKFNAIESRYKDMTFEAIEDMKRRQSVLNQGEQKNSLQAEITLIHQIESIIAGVDKSENVEIKDIRSNRKKEQETRHKDFVKEAGIYD
ncbi:integrase catalytic domain-containing protein [Acetobacterium malicum]|uniref:integrase catalytic domain-containing protein n=1 Tax=Acetobacterium malicum TaxID=52692 RepID=UPI000418C57C|nr:DDE-type integrase/transposase/recombinase [Acetobacterium dehalogenans]